MTSTAPAAPSATTDPSDPSEPAGVRRSRRRLGAFLVGMGVLHVVAPKPFEAIVPDVLGHQRELNLLAAAAEGASGLLLLSPSSKARRLGGLLATATIVGVYPANISMAIKAGAPTSGYALATWLRLPLQFPLISLAWRHARGPEGRS